MDRSLRIPTGYPYAGNEIKEIITPKMLQDRVAEIGSEISEVYKNEIPIIIGVLNGAFLFMADLVRNLSIQFEVDFIKIDSYGENTKSSGTVRLVKDISANITDRDVIIVEDIVDTGLSLNFLKNRMLEASPKSLRFATCLYKSDIAVINFKIDWICLNVDNNYLIGYGLDLKQIYRGLPGIYIVKKDNS